MKKLRHFSLVLLCLLSHIVDAKTSLWKVSKGNYVLFLGGTIHVLSPEDYPLSCEFDFAYHHSSKLIFETDLSVEGKPEFRQLLLSRMVYPNAESIDQKLSAITYQELRSYLQSVGVPISSLMRFKPGMLLSVVSGIELEKLGMTIQGVDKFFYGRAIRDGRAVSQLESIDQQIGFLAGLGVGNEEKFIRYLLEDVRGYTKKVAKTKLAWLDGDMQKLYQVSETGQFKKRFPTIFNALLTDRNNAWLPQIESMLETPEIEYVLVGAMHMAGEVGLLHQLASKGYEIQQIDSCLSSN